MILFHLGAYQRRNTQFESMSVSHHGKSVGSNHGIISCLLSLCWMSIYPLVSSV